MIEKLARKAVKLLPGKLAEIGGEILDEAKRVRINTKLVDQVNLNDMAKNIQTINNANGFGLGEPRERNNHR